ncbi:short-chain dehydrogenase [Colletotrichum orchidophilum]|uniref:Short-chain dehydrogenase n=1 Tax=Colletotrichum orchidophilum TaxID=1209926 RepID=A0A1G4B0N1_9PEZI|nr:short-chain dehydrogenase [Colletotrichum orchidophilum]OHE94944.1 short-chain dehydrogenase [Colletotrichum orchidophilum]
MASSLELPPLSMGPGRLFLTSQFCATARTPPKDLSLSGKTAIVSGANIGLGLTCARQLLDHDLSHLIMAVRSSERGEAAAKTLRGSHPDATIEVWSLDMLSYKSIQDFVNRCSTLPRIDFVILNAGMVQEEFKLSPAGHEQIFQVNYLSTVLLAILLLPVLKSKKTSGQTSRLTIVNSGTAFMAKFPEQDKRPLIAAFDDEKAFDATDRYSTSKLLGQLFIIKLAEHVQRQDVVVNLVDPGFCKGSGLHRHIGGGIKAVMEVGKTLTGRSLELGASTYFDAAVVRGEETHGSYLMDWKIFPFANFVYTPRGKTTREQLWEETLQELDFAGVRSILRSMQSDSR